MDVSDDDEPSKKKQKTDFIPESKSLKEENDVLRCQIEAYKNEVNYMKYISSSTHNFSRERF